MSHCRPLKPCGCSVGTPCIHERSDADAYGFQCDSTDEGRDVSEGEMAYRIEERDGCFLLVEYLADEPEAGIIVEWCKTRAEAERELRQYLSVGVEGDEADGD